MWITRKDSNAVGATLQISLSSKKYYIRKRYHMQNQTDIEPCHCDNDEIELFELFVVLWKRKRIIFAITIVATVAAVIISSILPKIYYVDAIIQPGKDTDDKSVISPQEIVETIDSGVYDIKIAESLTIPIGQIPTLKASVPKGTDMVKISLNSSEPQLAKKIISELLNIISTAIQKEQDLSIQKIKSKMEAVILNHKMLEESVSQAKKQAAESKLKIDDLKKKKFEALINNNGDALTLLLYINEIRNSQVYFNELNDKVAELENSYQNISLRLEQFRLNLEDIKGTVIRKEPTILEKPIKPNKKLIVATTFVGSFMVAVMLAFLFEFVSRLREA